MNRLFQQRRQKHFLLLLRYWRLVFNDHFVIALFFLFGALAYGYAQMLPTVPAHNLWIEILMACFLTIIAQLGRLATLVQRADPVFLLPQTSKMKKYFEHAYVYSWWLAAVISLLGVIITLPLAFVTQKTTPLMVSQVIIIALLVKTSWLNLDYLRISIMQGRSKLWRWLKWLFPLVTWLVTWLITPVGGLLIAILEWLWSSWLVRTNQEVNWRKAVEIERDRMTTVYRFFNLFTDVPNMQGTIKRRRLLNPLMNWLGGETTWRYLYSHGLVRNTEISDLVARLTLIMAVILFFVPVVWLNSIILVLALYLIAAQLVPLYDQFANNAFTYVYPIPKQDQYQEFRTVIRKVLLIVGVVLVVSSVGQAGHWEQVGLNLVIAVVEVPLLTNKYLEDRIKKL